MQPPSSFNSNLGRAILLLGPPGGGKSVLGCRLFPKTYVYLTDLNFESAKTQLTKMNEFQNLVGIDIAGVDEKGVPRPLQQRYPHVIKSLDEAEKSPEVETIFIDSATFLAPIFMAKLTMATTIDTIKWDKERAGDYLRIWQSLIDQLRTSGKRLIIAAHERIAEDRMEGKILYNQINLWGGLRDNIANMMSDVWRCEVHASTVLNGKSEYKVRVIGDIRNKLKNNFSWEEALLPQDEVVKRVRATLKPSISLSQ